MNKPELYNAANQLQRTAVLSSLEEFNDKIKWKETGDTAIDLGCGDGVITVLVKDFSPYNGFTTFVGSDISEGMVKFANKTYASEVISFRVFDIGGEVPKDMKGAFNHVFSFFAIHWVKNQEKAFKNVFNLMSHGGDCLITFLATTALYSVYAALVDHPKWKSWLNPIDLFLSPYHYVKNPKNKVEEIMRKCGFKNIDVSCRKCTNTFDSIQSLKELVQSVEPYNMPNEVFDDFFQDYLITGEKIGMVNFKDTANKKTGPVFYDYFNIIIYATK